MTRGGGARRHRHAGRALLAAALAIHCAASPIPPRQISHSGAGAYEAALTTTGDGFVAAWYDVRDGNGELYLRRIDARGEPVGAEMRLTRHSAESYEPSLDAFDDGRLAIAWYDKDASGALAARVGVWTPDGANVWTRPLPAPSRNPVLAVSDGTIVIAWVQQDAAAADAEDVWVSMSSLIPAIEPWGARFALAWNEFVPSSGGHDGRSEIAFTIAP